MENEALSALQQKLKQERIIHSANDLQVGDIIYIELDRHDGLTLNGDYNVRLKYVVVAGSKNNQKEFAVELINSDADFSNDPEWRAEQYPLLSDNYHGVLEHDSWVDCTDPKEITLRKMKAKQAEKVGCLLPHDLNQIMKILKNSDFVDTHFKKVYQILSFETM